AGAGNSNCSWSFVTTYTIRDACGNTVSPSPTYTYSGGDKTAPALTCPPAQSFCYVASNTYTIPLLSATDNCGTVTVSYAITGATTRSGTGTNASGLFNTGVSTITWTVKDGCNNTATCTTTVTVNPLPSVSIVASSPNFCSNLTLTAVPSPAGSYTYLWSPGGQTSSSINLTGSNADGNYSVTVRNSNGCTATATYNYIKQNSINVYTILGLKNVNLGKTTQVNGSVGNNANGMKVVINQNSTVNGFVKSSLIQLNQPVTVTGGLYYSPATVSLPGMLYNTAIVPAGNFTVPDNGVAVINTNYNNLTIGKAANVTIRGNIYGTIHIKEGAVVTFTGSDVNINYLTMDNGKPGVNYTTAYFNAGASIRIKNTVTIGNRNRIYGNAIFFMGDLNPDAEKVAINGTDTWFYASVYMPHGQLGVHGSAGPCIMNGQYIAEDIKSDDLPVTWNGNNCNNNSVAALRVASSTPPVVINSLPPATQQFEVKVAPNPSETDYRLQVTSSSGESIKVTVVDILGREVKQLVMQPYQTLIFGNDLKKGSYLVHLIQGTNRKTVKLIKL
ncbi:MAG: T9SS type A sorting domain-containing protein, partial [Sphingobacteriales bacterium]